MFKNFCDIVDYIPTVPEYLIESLEEIQDKPDTFDRPWIVQGNYCTYNANENLTQWCEQFFDVPIGVRYTVIKKQMPVHIDLQIPFFGKKYNYLITTGGNNIATRWWDSVTENRTMLYQVVNPVNTWHTLNIKIPHDISEITEPRISINIISLK